MCVYKGLPEYSNDSVFVFRFIRLSHIFSDGSPLRRMIFFTSGEPQRQAQCHLIEDRPTNKTVSCLRGESGEI